MRNLALLVLIFFGFGLKAQQVKINVSDKNSNHPLPFAHICTVNQANNDKKYQITDKNGSVLLKIRPNTIISISYVGYNTIIDTITTLKEQLEYKLETNGFNIDEVVITGQYKPIKADKSIYRIKVIDQSIIQQKSANNLAELLSNELNIKVSHDPSTGSGLKIQGISGQNVKILVDGVSLIGRLDGDIDLTQINLSNVEHIEIVEGPMSVVYGSNALAGVINIITKNNYYSRFKAAYNSYFESIGIYNFDLNLSINKKKNSVTLSGGRNFFAGFDSDQSTRSVEFKPKEQYNTSLSYSYISQKINIKFKNDLFKEHLLNRSNLIATPYSIKGYDIWFYTIRINSGIQINQEINNTTSYNILMAYSYYNRSKKSYLKDMTNLESTLSKTNTDHDTTRFNSISTRGIFNWDKQNKKISLQTGFDLNMENGKGKRMKVSKEKISDYAIFSSIMWNITPNLSFQPAIRAAYNTKYTSHPVYSINFKFIKNELNVRTSYARGFRAPSLKELYLYFYDSNHQIEGNENLKAEHSHNFNLSVGYGYHFDKNYIALIFKTFYNNINNMITLVQVDPDNDLHYRNQNVGHFESYGGEFLIEYRFFSRIKIQVGIARLGRTDFYNEKKFIYNNNYNSNLSINFWKNSANFSVFYNYFGKYPFYTFYNDQLEIANLDSYQNLDFTFSKTFFNKSLTITTGIKNMFDNTIISASTTPNSSHGTSSGVSSLAGWGRTCFIGLKYTFTKY